MRLLYRLKYVAFTRPPILKSQSHRENPGLWSPSLCSVHQPRWSPGRQSFWRPLLGTGWEQGGCLWHGEDNTSRPPGATPRAKFLLDTWTRGQGFMRPGQWPGTQTQCEEPVLGRSGCQGACGRVVLQKHTLLYPSQSLHDPGAG